jgi:tetratricopeptide (TPR) repeat protein
MLAMAPATRFVERRQHVRFQRKCRVRYRHSRQWRIDATRDISEGGMLLGGPMKAGQELDFMLEIPFTSEELCIRGHVLGFSPAGTHIAFARDAHHAREQIGGWIREVLIPELEYDVGSAVDDTLAIVGLAAWYRKQGRAAEGVRLYRAAAEARPRGLGFIEQRAVFLLEVASESGSQALLDELRQVLAAGAELGQSDILGAIEQELQSLERPNPARPEEVDIKALRESIKRHRAELYAGFSDLLAETQLLRELESQSNAPEPNVPRPSVPRPQRKDLAAVLDTIREQLEHLRDSAAQPQAEAPAKRSRWREVERYASLGIAVAALAVAAGLATRANEQRALQAPPEAAALVPQAESTTTKAAPVRKNTGKGLVRPAPKPEPAAVVAPEPPPAPPAPAPADVHFQHGRRLLEQKKVKAAMEELERAVAADPNHVEALRALGLVYQAVGREKSAKETFRRFVELAPNHPDAKKLAALLAADAG